MRSTMRILAAISLAAMSSKICAKPVDLQMGTRGFGMGGAFAGVADDATAAYWNPAGLAKVTSLTLSETNWLFQDIKGLNVNYLTGSIPLEHVGTVAGGWLVESATLKMGNPNDGTEETHDMNQHGFTLSGGRRLWEKLGFFHNTSVGVGLNRYVLSSGDQNSAGTGFDVGFLTDFPMGFRLGLVGKNLGADQGGEKLEPEYRAGLSYQWMNERHRILAAMDLATKSDVEYSDASDGVGTNYKAFLGAEYAFSHMGWSFALRGGANNSLRNSRDGIVYTVGAGGSYSGIALQYAFQSDTRDDISLGNTHRITLELSLDGIRKLAHPAAAAAAAETSAPAATAPETQAAAPAAPAAPVAAPAAPATAAPAPAKAK
jgi:hypothetical protein